MTRALRSSALLLTVLALSCRSKAPEPPSFDLIATAWRMYVEAPEDAGAPGTTARTTWIDRVVRKAAYEDAIFAATGDTLKHYEIPEPDWKSLEDGMAWPDCMSFLQKRQEEEFGAAVRSAPVPDTAFLRGGLTRDTLAALLQERIDGFKVSLAARHPAPPAPSGTAPVTVWLLTTGHPVEAKRRKAVEAFEKRFPGKARFITVERKDEPALFATLGKRLTAACVVGDQLIKDLTRLDQFAEMIVGPEAVPAATLRHPEFRFIDAHEHAIRSIGTFIRMLDLNQVTCSVVAALPTGPKHRGAHEANLRLLEEAKLHPGRIIPLVVMSPHSADPVGELKEYLVAGARGVKLLTGHGDVYKADPVELDVKPMRDLFRFCEERRIPVLWHVNTHLYRHGFLRVLEDFPKLVVVNPHLGGYLSYAPGMVRRLLKEHPNLCLDFSFGVRTLYARRALEDLSMKRDEWRALLAEFPDRFMAGADMTFTPDSSLSHGMSQLEIYRSLFEEETYDFDPVPDAGRTYLEANSEHRAGLRGLNLPEDLIRKIYWENPRRIYGTP